MLLQEIVPVADAVFRDKRQNAAVAKTAADILFFRPGNIFPRQLLAIVNFYALIINDNGLMLQNIFPAPGEPGKQTDAQKNLRLHPKQQAWAANSPVDQRYRQCEV